MRRRTPSGVDAEILGVQRRVAPDPDSVTTLVRSGCGCQPDAGTGHGRREGHVFHLDGNQRQQTRQPAGCTGHPFTRFRESLLPLRGIDPCRRIEGRPVAEVNFECAERQLLDRTRNEGHFLRIEGSDDLRPGLQHQQAMHDGPHPDLEGAIPPHGEGDPCIPVDPDPLGHRLGHHQCVMADLHLLEVRAFPLVGVVLCRRLDPDLRCRSREGLGGRGCRCHGSGCRFGDDSRLICRGNRVQVFRHGGRQQAAGRELPWCTANPCVREAQFQYQPNQPSVVSPSYSASGFS